MAVQELIPEIGVFVSQDHRRIAEIIEEYDADLSLIWIPPDKRELDETFPFAILHTPNNKAPYIVRYVREEDMDERLLAWVACSDDNNLNAKLDAEQWAREQMQKKANEELSGEQMDFAKSVIGGKNYFRHGGKTYS